MKDKRQAGGQSGSRGDRLAAALRANLARRKAQARARADDPDAADVGAGHDGDKNMAGRAEPDTGRTEGNG